MIESGLVSRTVVASNRRQVYLRDAGQHALGALPSHGALHGRERRHRGVRRPIASEPPVRARARSPMR